MAEEYLEYVTEEGDRWDLIAWRFYGDPHAYEPIIRANPRAPIRPVLDSGIRLLIPVRARRGRAGRPAAAVEEVADAGEETGLAPRL